MIKNKKQTLKNEHLAFFNSLPDGNLIPPSLEYKTLSDFINIQPNESLLEVGCGSGQHSLELSKNFKNIITCIEPLKNRTSQLKNVVKKNKIKNLKIKNCSIQEFNSKIKFDIILIINVIHHTPNRNNTIKCLRKFLKPNGRIIMFENNSLNPLFLLFFIFIGELKIHLTRNFFKSNRFYINDEFLKENLHIIKIKRYGFLPTKEFSFGLSFNKLNSLLNNIPIIKELTAFYLYEFKNKK
jgi:2-polyprenyl-3-methyl-5-hydroxy-6-metoxy-1,4-benzoquinol methylase